MQDSTDPARPKYRPDIDGLRGLAVLAVVGFHAFPGLVKAGFIGVDVFFVISGYLITTIIVGALEKGTFSFREFYVRRIRRIFPALIVILAAVFAIGWRVLSAGEYVQPGLHIVGGATFTSNFMLWRESGYFDSESDRKVLLHLWSLAVEEQFYLFFPIVLWLAHKRRVRPLAAVSAIGLASFVWNIHVAVAHPTMDFYSPQTRAWELMLGAALACALFRAPDAPASRPPSWIGRLFPEGRAEKGLGASASAVGAALLGLGLILIVKGNPFPGWAALLPTLGTVLLIFGGARSWINRRLLSNRALVQVGLISYPLYLWHWPLLSFAYIQTGGTPPRTLKAAIVVVSVVLAWLTYRFIERPLRFGRGGRSTTVSLMICLASLGLIGFSVFWSGGFASRAVARKLDPYLATAKATVDYGGCEPIVSQDGFCRLGGRSAPPSVFVYGDSHAGSMRPALARYAYETGRTIDYYGVGGCLLGMYTASADDPAKALCQARSDAVFAYVRDNHIPNVFMIARWSNYGDAGAREKALQDGLGRILEAYRAIGVHVYLFVDNPLQKYQPVDALRKSQGTDASINAFSVTTDENSANQAWMVRLLSAYADASVTVLDFTDAYCPDGSCPMVKDGKFLYLDHDHLSTHGSMLIYPELVKALEKM